MFTVAVEGMFPMLYGAHTRLAVLQFLSVFPRISPRSSGKLQLAECSNNVSYSHADLHHVPALFKCGAYLQRFVIMNPDSYLAHLQGILEYFMHSL